MVYVFLANGFEEIEALAFTDILRRAEIEVKTVSIYTESIVTGSHGIPVMADITLNDISDAEIEAVVLPGGMPGTLNLKDCAKVIELIRYAYDNGKYVGAICAAPMILGEMNLLNGRRATCYPGFEKYLSGAVATGAKVECDNKIITSKGAGTASDFAHCFITELKDEKLADKVIESMYY